VQKIALFLLNIIRHNFFGPLLCSPEQQASIISCKKGFSVYIYSEYTSKISWTFYRLAQRMEMYNYADYDIFARRRWMSAKHQKRVGHFGCTEKPETCTHYILSYGATLFCDFALSQRVVFFLRVPFCTLEALWPKYSYTVMPFWDHK
jgi:hypothetical protein